MYSGGGYFSIVSLLISFLFASCTDGTNYVGGSSGGSGEYTVTISTETKTGGTVTADMKNASEGDTVTITVSPEPGYELDTLSVRDNDNKDVVVTTVSEGTEYTFTMPEGNVTVDATFKEQEKEPAAGNKAAFTIKFDKNGSDATGTMADKTGSEGATVTLPASSFTRDGFALYEWNTAADGSGTAYADGADIVLSADMTLYVVWAAKFHETVTALDAGTDGTAGTSASYVYFGDFPNTVKDSAVTVSETKTKVMGGLTYYLGSDGYWYAKCAENAYGASYTYSNGTTVGQGSTSEKYFRAEPIKWRVLTENYTDATGSPTGKKLLLAENILTGSIKYYLDTSNRTIGGNTVYPNNYKYSMIRAYLNGSYEADDTQATTYSGKGFLQSAFTSSAQSLIATMGVDNSAASTTDTGGSVTQATAYACADTSDKIFLLSEKEVTDYGFEAYDAYGEGNTRIRVTTDWARANYAQQSHIDGDGGWWWLRSPISNSKLSALVVRSDGSDNSINHVVSDRGDAVVPALCVD